METINLSDVKKLIATAHSTLCVVLHALDTKILIGEINRPLNSPPKIKRKRRTKAEMAFMPPIKMDLEKEYQAGRTSPSLSEANRIGNLPEDKDPFFAKAKKKREKKIDGGE